MIIFCCMWWRWHCCWAVLWMACQLSCVVLVLLLLVVVQSCG
jgi:hypothetical protein